MRIRSQPKRWSEHEAPFKSSKPFCETFKRANIYIADTEQLFSSFSPDMKFYDMVYKRGDGLKSRIVSME